MSSITALGTSTAQILFTSAATTPAQGDWYGIDFNTGSTGTLAWTDVAFALTGIDVFSGASPSVSNSDIHGCSQYGVYVRTGGTPTLTGNFYYGNADSSGDFDEVWQ